MKLHCFLISWFVITCSSTPLTSAQQSPAPHVLTIFFKPALKQYCEGKACDVLEHMHIPGYLNRTLLNHKLMAQIVSGIYVTYGGTVTHSDYNGQVSFPLTQAHDQFTVVVTDAIKPVLLFSNTVQHLETVEGAHTDFFSFTRSKDADKHPVWTIQKIEAPHAHAIPDESIIIFSQPDHVIIAEGIFKADEGQNAILPHIYVTDATPVAINALQFVKIAKFFNPVHKSFGYARDRYTMMIGN